MSQNSVEKFIEAINTEDVDGAINLVESSGLLNSNNWSSRYKFLKQDDSDKNNSGIECNSYLNLLRLLLHRESKEFVTKMFRQAVKEDLEVIASFLLEDMPNKINVNAYNEDGKTALHAAICCGSTSLMYILLDHGADIHAKPTKPSNLDDIHNEDWEDTIGKTALHLAATFGESEMIQILLTCGADVHATDAAGSTSLHVSCYNFWNRIENVSVLLEAGANCNIKDNLGRTPLHVAVMEEQDVTFIKKLLEYGADVNITCNDAMTPLGYAASVYHLSDDLQVLKEHIIALKALDLYVSDGNLKYIDLKGKDRETFEECKKELAVKICSSNISVYDFLTGSTKQLVAYLQDENLCETLENISRRKICCGLHREICCPLYQNIIVARYNHGKERKRLLSSGLKYLNIALVDLFGKELPVDIVLKVVEYCSNEELKHLIKSANSES